MPQRLLNRFLEKEGVEKELAELLGAIARAGKYVAHALRTGDLGLAGTSNLYGEHQLALDVLADKVFTEHLRATNLVHTIASEEQDGEEILHKKGLFSVAFDPLDGSSLVDTNLAVGAIFGIFSGAGFIGRTGREMVAACYLVFGPRTIFVVALPGKTMEFTLNELGEFMSSRAPFKIAPEAKTFSPGNLRACREKADYTALVDKWRDRPLTLRYSGGMVPDIHAIFAKGSGIFAYPSYSKYPEGKLRLLFECAPLAFAAEQAGGKALDEHGAAILDLKITAVHQRTTIFLGSAEEVERGVGKT